MGKRTKSLYKGIFSVSGQVLIYYRRAYSPTHARRLFLNAMSESLGVGTYKLRGMFGGRTDNYRVEKIEERKEAFNART